MKKIMIILISIAFASAQDVTIKSSGTDASKGIVFKNSDDSTLVDIDGDGLLTAKGNIAVGNGKTSAGKISFYEDADNGSNAVSLQAGTLSADVTFTLPTADGTSGQVLNTDGSGVLSWSTVSTSSTSGTHSVTGTSESAGVLKLFEDTDDGTNFVSLKAATMDADVNYILPTADGTSGQVLSTDGSGTLSWTSSSGSSSINGLSDALIEDNSLYLGNDPSSTTSTAEYNVAVGTTALDAITTGDGNAAFGHNSLTANTTGAYNVGIGNSTLAANTSGESNLAIGHVALGSNTTGDYNVGVGQSALNGNTTGLRNTALGYGALDYPDTENDNLAIGYDALGGSIAGGEYNVAIGNYSLDATTSGDNNTATGYDALTGTTTGADNTALGYEAGDVITTGSQNVIIGSGSDPSAISASNQIVIGYGATGHGNNIAVIGNGSATAIHPHDDNEVDLGSSSYEYKDLYVDGTAYLDAIGMGSTAMTLPAADGSANQVLKTDGSGTLSWSTSSGGASNVTGLSDALVEDNSIYIGNDPSATTSTAEYNVAIGATALDAVTTGDGNVAVGYSALTANTTGIYNSAIGNQSLYSNAGGHGNAAMGWGSMSQNTSGGYNVAVGMSSLYANTTGSNNVSIGYLSLNANTTSSYNVGVGYQSLWKSTGQQNTAIGSNSLLYNSTGTKNTAIGYGTGAGTISGWDNRLTTGTENVLLGYQADASKTDANNQIVIGYNATGQGDNYAVIGNADITRLYAAQDGAGVLYADGTIQSSDRRIKKEINDLAYGLNFIKRLRPVSYYKLNPQDYPQALKDKFYPNGNVREVASEDYNKLQVGFIAQEVKAVIDELDAENNIVSIDEDGFHRMDYQKIVVPLVKAVQELSAKVEKLENQLESNSTEVVAKQ